MKRSFAMFIAAAAACATVASADTKKPKPKPKPVNEQVLKEFNRALIDVPATPYFAFTPSDTRDDPTAAELRLDFEIGFWLTKSTVALAADGKAAWVAADMAWAEPCGDETCPEVPRPDGHYHGTLLFDGKSGWKPVAWHVATPVTAREQAAAMKKSPVLGAFEPYVGKGAEEVVALFEKTIGEPKALARTVSKRTDVVLYGSELKERYVGGKKVAAQLAKWNLGFKVTDESLHAGVTSSGSVAWIAAHLDAVSLKKVGAKPTPYRALFIYEKYDGAWQLVQAHFSFVP